MYTAEQSFTVGLSLHCSAGPNLMLRRGSDCEINVSNKIRVRFLSPQMVLDPNNTEANNCTQTAVPFL